MTVADLITLFDLRDLPMVAVQQMEADLWSAHHHKGLGAVDQALFWALRNERQTRQRRAVTVTPAPPDDAR